MSVVCSSEGSCLNSSQVHLLGSSTSPTTEKSHSSRDVCGVGPAERSGKPSSKYWPGGNVVSWRLRRPKKPREKNPSPMLLTSSILYPDPGSRKIPSICRVSSSPLHSPGNATLP